MDFSGAVMALPGEGGTSYAFKPEGAVLSDAGNLLVPIHSEATPVGKGFVRAMWFEKEVSLWLKGQVFALRPYRCHIVGEVFSEMYLAAKARDSSAEVAAVWELIPEGCAEAADAVPAPETLHLSAAPEYHLDHPSLRPVMLEPERNCLHQ